jgi:hypothetical protein
MNTCKVLLHLGRVMPSTITRHHWLTPLSSTTSSLRCSLPNTTCLPITLPRPATVSSSHACACHHATRLLVLLVSAQQQGAHTSPPPPCIQHRTRIHPNIRSESDAPSHNQHNPATYCPMKAHSVSLAYLWMWRSMDALEDWMGALEEENGTLWKMGRTRWILGRLEVSRYIFRNPSSCAME